MNILPSGSSYTFTLPANNQLTVTSRGGTTVTGPGGLLGTIDGTRTFGGYGGDTIITIAAVGNDCEYGVTEPGNAKLTATPSGGVAIIDPRDGSLLGLVPASYTWAGKPAASASNAGQTIRITDVGKSASGSLWQSDGTIWRPVNGSVLIAQGNGSLASPLVSFTGAAAGAFTLPAGNPLIPASMLPIGAQVRVVAMMRRRGVNGTATFSARLGTAGTSTDSVINAAATTATDVKDSMIDAAAIVNSATGFTAQNWLAPQGVGVSAMVDRTTNVNTAAAMSISFDMAGANAADSFDLIAYQVFIEF